MNLVKTTIFLMIMSGHVIAQNVHVTGTVSTTLNEPIASVTGKNLPPVAHATKTREIKLLKIELSNKALRTLKRNVSNALYHLNQPNNMALNQHEKLPSIVQLRMNNVPVLNQGSHGTCATFAVTAAIDAVLNKGAYLSELCPLQLGNYLAENGYTQSAWNGAIGRQILSQMDIFGIVSKEQESIHGCGELFQYPTDGNDPTSSISTGDYFKISEPLAGMDNITWWPVLDIFQAFTDRIDTNTTLSQVKAALAKGDRLMFGVLMLDFDQGMMGAVGTKNHTFDTWVLTPEIARDVILRPTFGGHAMVITSLIPSN